MATGWTDSLKRRRRHSTHGGLPIRLPKRAQQYQPTVGEDLEIVRQDHCVKTHPADNRNRRTLQLKRESGGSWGFTLQSYGLHHKSKNSVEHMTYVDYIELGGPAHMAGLRKGDIILSINGVSTEDQDHLAIVRLVRSCGDSLRMVVLFEDCAKKVELHLRYIKLRKLLAAKEFELNSIDNKIRRLQKGQSSSASSSTHRLSMASTCDLTSTSDFSPVDDHRWSLVPNSGGATTPDATSWETATFPRASRRAAMAAAAAKDSSSADNSEQSSAAVVEQRAEDWCPPLPVTECPKVVVTLEEVHSDLGDWSTVSSLSSLCPSEESLSSVSRTSRQDLGSALSVPGMRESSSSSHSNSSVFMSAANSSPGSDGMVSPVSSSSSLQEADWAQQSAASPLSAEAPSRGSSCSDEFYTQSDKQFCSLPVRGQKTKKKLLSTSSGNQGNQTLRRAESMTTVSGNTFGRLFRVTSDSSLGDGGGWLQRSESRMSLAWQRLSRSGSLSRSFRSTNKQSFSPALGQSYHYSSDHVVTETNSRGLTDPKLLRLKQGGMDLRCPSHEAGETEPAEKDRGFLRSLSSPAVTMATGALTPPKVASGDQSGASSLRVNLSKYSYNHQVDKDSGVDEPVGTTPSSGHQTYHSDVQNCQQSDRVVSPTLASGNNSHNDFHSNVSESRSSGKRLRPLSTGSDISMASDSSFGSVSDVGSPGRDSFEYYSDPFTPVLSEVQQIPTNQKLSETPILSALKKPAPRRILKYTRNKDIFRQELRLMNINEEEEHTKL